MNTVVLRRQTEDQLRRHLVPGEQVAAGSMVTSDPSRWGAAVWGVASLALGAVGVLILLGALPSSPALTMAALALGWGVLYLPRPMYVMVTDRRLVCCRLSRFRRRPRGSVIAAPLHDLRIVAHRQGQFGASIRCEVPGRKPIVLHWSRASRADFARVEMILARSGAFAKDDPPYPPLIP